MGNNEDVMTDKAPSEAVKSVERIASLINQIRDKLSPVLTPSFAKVPAISETPPPPRTELSEALDKTYEEVKSLLERIHI